MVAIIEGRVMAEGPCCASGDREPAVLELEPELELELELELEVSRVIASGEMAAAGHRRVQAMAPI